MASPSPSSGLVVLVPEAEPLIGPRWDRLAPGGRRGVTAHVTVVFPFAPRGLIDDAVLARLRGLLAPVRAFGLELGQVSWFGDSVVWLAPSDPAPLIALTRLVVAAFPDYPPYEGQFSDPVPHLTVLHGDDAPPGELRAAAAEVAPRLPVRTSVSEVTLLVQDVTDGLFTPAAAFPLAG